MKVECIDDTGWIGWGTIVKGQIYTVKSRATSHTGEPAFHLVEVRSISGCPYFAQRFRPLVERKTSIEIFTRLLNPSPEKVIAEKLEEILLAALETSVIFTHPSDPPLTVLGNT